MGKTAKCIEMLQILAGGKKYKNSELADRLNVNVRNITEYRKELQECGYAFESTPGKYGGIDLKKSTVLPSLAFTKEERDAGPTNFIMGLAFITEGAIPFAASDPLRVLPSCIAGSAVAGALSMAFGCTLMAPHGGIFVFPVVGHAAMYLLALVVGSIISALLLGVLKKKVVA